MVVLWLSPEVSLARMTDTPNDQPCYRTPGIFASARQGVRSVRARWARGKGEARGKFCLSSYDEKLCHLLIFRHQLDTLYCFDRKANEI